jgi:diacylglycerol kinase (ATP)
MNPQKTRQGRPKLLGMAHFFRAFSWSIKGFKSAFKGEAAFRHELFLVAVLAPIGCWLGDSNVERALLVGSAITILIVELINIAIESAIDRVGPEYHVLSGRAKDVGSASVFLTICLVVVVWGLILLG